MKETTKNITLVDPGAIDGTPYEAAGKGTKQLEHLMRMLTDYVEAAELQARNAELSRRLHRDENAEDITDWEDTIQSKKFTQVYAGVELLADELERLSQAAGFDPTAPLE